MAPRQKGGALHTQDPLQAAWWRARALLYPVLWGAGYPWYPRCALGCRVPAVPQACWGCRVPPVLQVCVGVQGFPGVLGGADYPWYPGCALWCWLPPVLRVCFGVQSTPDTRGVPRGAGCPRYLECA